MGMGTSTSKGLTEGQVKIQLVLMVVVGALVVVVVFVLLFLRYGRGIIVVLRGMGLC